MDKYTVDLDKVLNDFEYSELTQNYNADRSYAPQATPTYASSSKLKAQGEARHSITNVFHSLNEYLNSDISGSAKLTRDSKSYLNASDNETYNDVKPVTFPCLLTNHLAQPKVKLLHPSKPADEPEDATHLDYSERGKNLVNGSEATFKNDLVVEPLDLQQEISSASLINRSEPSEDANVIKDLIDVEVTVNEIMQSEELTTQVDSPKVCMISNNNLIDSEPVKEEEKEEEVNFDVNADVSDTEHNTEPPEHVVRDEHSDSVCTKQETLESVKFGDSFDIDESTLNKYLDDLEEEYKSHDFDDGKVEGNEIFEPDVNKTCNSEEINSAPLPINAGDIGSELVNVEEKVVELVSNEDEAQKNLSEDLDDNETRVQNSDEHVPQEVMVEHVSSVERPTSLDLSDEHAVTREINLIGNPGSTPYNNVYISKELQESENKTFNLEDSDTSTSASPTFSEASTDTVNSTDSTDTEVEDVHNKQSKTKYHHAKAANKLVRETASQSQPVSVSDGNVAAASEEEEMHGVVEHEQASAVGQRVEEHVSAAADVEDVTGSGKTQSGQENADMAFWLGKQAPLWIPDSEALSCLHCDARFTVIKRRHHCRACGLVLCSKCCNLKYKLEYLDAEARVCTKCYTILNRDTNSSSGSEVSPVSGNSPHHQANQPNPNNPMEYCSVVPPLQQVSSSASQNPPTVMVPVGVLKRKGSNKGKSNKSVMFCDGIRPGSDLTKLDTDFNYNIPKSASSSSKSVNPPTAQKINRNLPPVDPVTKSFVPSKENQLPPTVTVFKSDITYTECSNKESVVEMLKNEKLTFALQRNLHVHVKIINMDCCINKQAWCFSTEGLISVGQDEVVYLIEVIESEKTVPIDVFHHINGIYIDAIKGTTVTEMGISLHNSSNFLDFKNHAGFLYIRPTFQCLQNIIRPSEPYLIGLLIHRWETPWAKIFPLRLVLRLGAEYRYYPCPIISTRHRDSLYVEIGHTIINLLADFRNFSYTLPNIRGLTIHMEDKNTTVTIPENRYDQVMKSLNNSSDHILAFGGNFSSNADSHLVCIQDTQGNNENAYTTHAINIHNKPRKVTGASFIVFNGALKSTSGLTAKSSIVEDGLMIQIPPEHMIQVRESLRNMKNHTIQCGCVNAPSDETVHIIWGEPDANFNIGVTSPIDNQSFAGVPSIRVHSSKDYVSSSDSRLIRWTEVFILQNTDENSKTQDPVDISKIAESISKATCQALVKYLDLLSSNNFYKIGIRTTLHIENVSYSAGSNNVKLPPIYMKNLDNELIPVLHRITSNNLGENAVTLELIFRILNT